jgi:hypothetical protein
MVNHVTLVKAGRCQTPSADLKAEIERLAVSFCFPNESKCDFGPPLP